ncbi:zf-RVT domain-containing protein [Cephalotus follicularis]|uniref:Zf-RVT domain-containing protein n=1 Tax=Cephalotus follicularis TaxID=3775 RepID=A0A1Q3CIH1_CEPFO|nr:zf-RVT domain-containing protein [Cephalotus follicularis]
MHGESVHILYGHIVIYDAGLGSSAHVKEVISEGRWNWPQNSSELIEIQHRVQDIRISPSSDCIFWDSSSQVFSTHKAWNGIRLPSSEVPWYNLVWHSLRIPKHDFCLWLALRGAHKTRDKLRAHGVLHSAACIFNCGEEETLDHLFFRCPYTNSVWMAVLAMRNIARPILPWMDEIDRMIHHSLGRKFLAFVRKLALASTVYNLWIESDRSCFQNLFLPELEVVKKNRQEVACRILSSHNVQYSERHHNLCTNWGVS